MDGRCMEEWSRGRTTHGGADLATRLGEEPGRWQQLRDWVGEGRAQLGGVQGEAGAMTARFGASDNDSAWRGPNLGGRIQAAPDPGGAAEQK
jgi:hypothetical protein